MKLLLDKSSVLGAYMHTTDEEFGEDVQDSTGKMWHIPSPETCLERFELTMDTILEGMGVSYKDLICVNDPPPAKVTARGKILTTYKAKKRTSPVLFQTTRKLLFDMADKWLLDKGAIVATPKNHTEADDLINELALRLPDTTIITRDKDLLAIPTNCLFIDKEGHHWNPERFPVPPEYIHLYRTLVTGDPSDNVKGCKGFGPAKWDAMCEYFGAAHVMEELNRMFRSKTYVLKDELKDLVDEFPPFQKIIDQEEDLYKVYRVLRFLPVPAHAVKWQGGVDVGTSTLVTAGNYDEVLSKLKDEEFETAIIDYEADVCDESREWSKKSGVKVDVMAQEITGMGLRVNSDNYYFSVDHRDTDNITLDQLEAVLELLWGKKIVAHNAAFENTLTYNHFEALLPNIVDTMLMASYVDENDFMGLKHLSDRWLGYAQDSYEDTLNGRSGMRSVSGEEVLKYGLDDVIATGALWGLFNVIMTYEDTLKAFYKVECDALYYTTLCFINGVDFDEKEYRKLKEENDQNIEDSWERLSDKLLDLDWEGGEFLPINNMNILTLNKVYKAAHGHDLGEISSVKMAIRLMDDKELAKLAEDKDYELINEYYRRVWKPAAEFNIRSPKQMARLLYDVLKVKKRVINAPTAKMKKAGKPGNPASNEDAIRNAIAYDDTPHTDLLTLLIEYKGYLTKNSLFFDKWPSYVHWKTGKIHCSMRQSATTTRRFSHSKPNKAQLPKKKGKEVRNMMTVPDDDWVIWALDVDSQELKLQAHASQDPNFLACYIGDEKKDVHALTGVEVARKQRVIFPSYDDFMKSLDDGGKIGQKKVAVIDEVTGEITSAFETFAAKPFRVSGKATNFATSYLCAAPKLGTMLCVTEASAQAFIDAKDAAFPGLMPAIRKYIRKCKRRGYSKTFHGARRHLAGHRHFGSRTFAEKNAAERLAWSFRIQSSGAEQIKIAAGSMYREGLLDKLNKPITIIHDELVGMIHKSVIEDRMPKMYDCVCQKYADMEIETSSTPEVGTHFGRLSKWAPKKQQPTDIPH